MSELDELRDQLTELRREFNEYRNTNPLERSSVRGGRLRFIGGSLVLDTGATLEIIGTLDGQGNFQWSGPWVLDSPSGGRIGGDVELSGDFDLTGVFTADGIRIEDGKIHVGSGASEIVIDGATGAITTGNVKIQDGKITVGTGSAQIVIDGATGKITVGGMAIDPADGGKVTFPGGAQLRADVGDGIQMQIGDVKISAQATSVSLSIGTRGLIINSGGFRFTSVPTKTAAATGLPAGAAHLDGNGSLFRITST